MGCTDPSLDDILCEAAARYGIPPERLTPLPGGHVTRVLAFPWENREYVLRITPPDEEINLDSTRAVLAFLQFVGQAGAPVPRPMPSLRGNLVETIPNPVDSNGRPYLVTAFPRADGALAEELPVEQWDDALVEAIGRAVGRFHAAAQCYMPGDPLLDRPAWEAVGSCSNPLSDLARALDPDSPDHWVLAKRAPLLQALNRLPRTPGCFHIIHNDLHFGNFYFDRASRSVTLLDFDDCAYGWPVLDIAMNLLDALVLYGQSGREGFAARFMDNYLRGYQAENTLPEDWQDQLPLFLKLLETGLYLQVARYHDPTDPDSWIGRFMTGRKERIEQDVPLILIEPQ